MDIVLKLKNQHTISMVLERQDQYLYYDHNQCPTMKFRMIWPFIDLKIHKPNHKSISISEIFSELIPCLGFQQD